MSKTYTTYVTTWGTDPLIQIQDMINKSVIQNNTKILLAFASFNFSGSGYVPGFNITLDETKQITELVHMQGAKIGLSVGGATYPFYGSDLYNNPGDLALNINNILNICNFDSVDFDVEDSYQNVPSNFAIQCASLINTLKSLNNNLSITLTTPAKAWAVGCYQQQLINLTIGNLAAWQPMEYDLWIDPASADPWRACPGSGDAGVWSLRKTPDYYQQIQYDINFYISTWGVSSNKIILGLMPGKDDIGHDLSLQDALNLTSFAISKNLGGVMTWDANIDSIGVDGNAPYAYSMGIQSILNKNLGPLHKTVNKSKRMRIK